MTMASETWRLVRAWYDRRRVQVGFTLRVTVAAVLSLAIAQYLELRLPLWAVLTALIVTQMSVGRSLKATRDYMDAIMALPAWKAWIKDAEAETWRLEKYDSI